MSRTSYAVTGYTTIPMQVPKVIWASDGLNNYLNCFYMYIEYSPTLVDEA